jgi:L-threonylcarbamoyladenylate synthase
MKIMAYSQESIRHAVEALKADELVIFPTDTLYALSANARADSAVKKVYAAKKRNDKQALPVFVRDLAHAQEFAIINAQAKELAKMYWPGALTMILRLKSGSYLSPYVSAFTGTVAVRAPRNKIVQELLKASKLPLVGTSANISGHSPVRTKSEILQDFQDSVALAIYGRAMNKSHLPSTIVDCTGKQLKIIRHGSLQLS